MIWFEWTTRKRTWAIVLLLCAVCSVIYATSTVPFGEIYSIVDRKQDLQGARVPFVSALHWGLLEFALILFAAWLGASTRENAPFLNLQPLSRTRIIGGRLVFTAGLLLALVVVSVLIQGLLMQPPTQWMTPAEFWKHLALDSTLIYLEALLVLGLSTLLSSFVPVSIASLAALTPILGDVVLRSAGNGSGGFWVASYFYTYSAPDLVLKGATPWIDFVRNNQPQQLLWTNEMEVKLCIAAGLAILVIFGALWCWKRQTAPGWSPSHTV